MQSKQQFMDDIGKGKFRGPFLLSVLKHQYQSILQCLQSMCAVKPRHRKLKKAGKAVTDRKAEVLPVIPVGLSFGIRIRLSVQPSAGNVNQHKAALDLEEGIWIHLFESGSPPYSPNQNRLSVP